MGAIAVLDAIERGQVERSQPEHFRAAIAYYPACRASTGDLTAPTLILIGERDDWTPAKACQEMAAHEDDIGITREQGDGAPISLAVYPDATHAFNVPAPARHYLGHFMQYDAAAAKTAETRVRTFLHDTLDVPSAVAPK